MYSKAEPLHRRTLAILERDRWTGDNEPIERERAYTLQQLAESCNGQGKHIEAELLWRRLLAFQEERKLDNELNLAIAGPIIHQIAKACQGQGKWAEAEQLWRYLLALQDERSKSSMFDFDNPYHPSAAWSTHFGSATATLLRNLAQVCRSQGKGDEVEASLRLALAMHEQWVEEAVGKRNPRYEHMTRRDGLYETSSILREYALVLRELQRTDEALQADARAETAQVEAKAIQAMLSAKREVERPAWRTRRN